MLLGGEEFEGGVERGSGCGGGIGGEERNHEQGGENAHTDERRGNCSRRREEADGPVNRGIRLVTSAATGRGDFPQIQGSHIWGRGGVRRRSF
ncbi:hypothetical protein LBMAG56_18770 [Verrucomicrobiota bacterium]|nr:hypothetical protein LBMAG56_18770 [Verrucomicrobiota bacterium]